jgi:hypothetical protein
MGVSIGDPIGRAGWTRDRSPARHPARFTDVIIERVQRILDAEHGTPILDAPAPRVLDPFAGTGGVHELIGYETLGVELEPEWAALHPRTILGDATALPFLLVLWKPPTPRGSTSNQRPSQTGGQARPRGPLPRWIHISGGA